MILLNQCSARLTNRAHLVALAILLFMPRLGFCQDTEKPLPAPSKVFAENIAPGKAFDNSCPYLEIRAEYLLWWTKNGPTPGPLVTTGSLLDAAPGALGMPHTNVLYGDRGLDYRLQSGGRWAIDWWFNEDRTLAFEPTGFILETHTIHFARDSDKGGTPVIGRPFFNLATYQPDAQVVTAPGEALGGIDVFSDSRLWNAEGNLIANVFHNEHFRGDLLAGFHYIGQDESFRISQSSTFLTGSTGFFGTTVLPPDILSLTDRVETRNEFFGAQIGARGAWQSGRWLANVSGKLGIGNNHQSVNIMGKTQRTGSDGVTLTGPGGLLDLGTNNGFRSRDEFTFASEVGVNIGCQVTSHLSASIGYTFFYWDNVARPGGQLTQAINPGYLPYSNLYGRQAEPFQPSFSFSGSSFWAQGISFGLTLSF